MPRLLLFAPCQNVIIDRENNTVSLISILQKINYRPKTELQGPTTTNIAVPMQWAVLAFWKRNAGEENKTFEQRLALLGDDDRVLLESVATWKFIEDSHRVITRALGFPIGTRHLRLVVWVRESGTHEWHETSEYPIEVVAKMPNEPLNPPPKEFPLLS